MLIIFVLSLYYEGGNTYDTPDKESLILVDKSTKNIIIDSNVVNIRSESISSSAFYPCRNIITSVSFRANSKCQILGQWLFCQTSIESIDFSNCGSLTVISNACFYNCKSLVNVILPPYCLKLSSGSFSSCSNLPLIDFSKLPRDTR